MAKIDTTKIEGYATMSAEEKLAALEGFEFENPAPSAPSDEVTKLKTMLSKANSEAADWKRQLRERQSEAEREAAERAEADAKLREELETLKQEKAVSGYKAKYLEVGYDAETAERSAKAMLDHDYGTIFADMKAFIENRTKDIEAKALNKQPGLSAGLAPSAGDKNLEAENRERAAWGLPPIKPKT